MSFLDKKPDTSISHSFANVGLSWAEFVELILSLTVEAYHLMKIDCEVKRDWEENVFTINLEEYLQNLAFDHGSIHVHSRIKQHTDKMRMGKQATIEANEIDLMLYGSWERNHKKIHFVWEAKRVGDKRISENYRKLNSEYVNEAIYRFIENKYAANVPDAGILGYVLAGDVYNIVADINQSMENLRNRQALDISNHLQTNSLSGKFKDRYQSQHTRTNKNGVIRLHHLFLTFSFD